MIQSVAVAWNAPACAYGVSSIEAMISPYVLWCSGAVKYQALARVLDVKVFSAAAQAQDLLACITVSVAAGQVHADAQARSPLAHSKLRAFAESFFNHVALCTKFDRLQAALVEQAAGTRIDVGVLGKPPGYLTVADYWAPQ